MSYNIITDIITNTAYKIPLTLSITLSINKTLTQQIIEIISNHNAKFISNLSILKLPIISTVNNNPICNLVYSIINCVHSDKVTSTTLIDHHY